MTWTMLELIAALCSFPTMPMEQKMCQVRLIDCARRGSYRATAEHFAQCVWEVQSGHKPGGGFGWLFDKDDEEKADRH